MAKKLTPDQPIRGLVVNAAGDTPTIYIYDEIGPAYWGLIDAASIVQALKEIGDKSEILVRLNTPGGDVFEAAAIYNHLRESKASIKIRIDGIAASAGSVIAMAGDTIEIASNAMIMIHEAWTIAVGNKADMAKTVTLLEKVDATMVETYVARTGNEAAKVEEWVAAETWFTADEAVEHGFADSKVINPKAVTPRIPKGRFKNAPAAIEQYDPKQGPSMRMVAPAERSKEEESTTRSRSTHSVASIAARTRVARARAGL